MSEPLLTTLDAGRYSLGEVLGQGGMATVYRAYDERLQVWRAVKVLSMELANTPDARERFLTEARAMARLSHPNIVQVHDIRPDAIQPFIVMEWVSAGDLAAHVRAYGPLPQRQAVEMMVGVLEALEAAHEVGVIHRDIKPQNVLLSDSGVPKVGDFGVARVTGAAPLTRTGSAMGTWGYMAPEQRSGSKDLTAAVDVYAAGATLYFALSGQVPVDLFASGLDEALLRAVDPQLRGLVQRATRYAPGERFVTCEEMQAALLAIIDALPSIPPGRAPLGALATEPKPGAPSVASAGRTLVPDALHGGRTLIPETGGAARGRTLVPDLGPPTGGGGVRADTLARHDFFQEQLDRDLGGHDEVIEEDSPRRIWLLFALLVALIALAVLAWPHFEAPLEPAPELESAPAEVQPDAPEAPPAEAPRAEAPRAEAPQSSPPVERASPERAPTRARAQARPSSETVAAPDNGSSLALVNIVGEAKTVYLQTADGTQLSPGPVPAGAYTLYASFDAGEPVVAGKLEIVGGEELTLRCDANFALCRAER